MTNLLRILILVVVTAFALNASAGGGAAHVDALPTSTPSNAKNAFEIDNRSELLISARHLDDVALEVTATARSSTNLVLPVKFRLQHGDEISFALPERPETVYTFIRDLGRVLVTVSEIEFSTASLID